MNYKMEKKNDKSFSLMLILRSYIQESLYWFWEDVIYTRMKKEIK